MFGPWQIRSTLPALLVLTVAWAAAGAAQDTNDSISAPTYRSTVSEVRVTFFATENNHSLPDLTRSDFAVVDGERVVRNFLSFTHADETSLDVVVLLDLSESVAPRVRTAIGNVLNLVEQEQSIPDDNISVLFFGGAFDGTLAPATDEARPAILCSGNCRASDSVTKLMAVRSGGSTPLFDALVIGADFISQGGNLYLRREGLRHVLILFSDGCDTISLHSARDAMQAAQDAGALIYSFDMGENSSRGSNFLRQVSEATGGRYFSLSPRLAQGDAAEVLKTALEDLRASYVVTYDLPSHESGFHSLRILPTHNLNLTFHSRNGYYFQPPDDQTALNAYGSDRR